MFIQVLVSYLHALHTDLFKVKMKGKETKLRTEEIYVPNLQYNVL